MKHFFKSKTKEGKVSEVAAKLASNVRELYLKHGKLNVGSLNCFYKIGVFGGDKIHVFESCIGNDLVEMIENSDKVAVHFFIEENGNASKLQIEYKNISQYEWEDFYYDYDGMKGNGVCFCFIFNGDIDHCLHWLHLEAA